MNFVDITLLILLGGFVLAGFWFGIIHMIGVLIGVVIGAFVSGQYYEGLGRWIGSYFGGTNNFIKVIAFLLLYVVTARLAGFLFWFFEKIFNFVAIIPFLKTFNRLLGAILGFVEGTLVLGLVVYVIEKFPFGVQFTPLLQQSEIAKAVMLVGEILVPLLPVALRAVQSVRLQ